MGGARRNAHAERLPRSRRIDFKFDKFIAENGGGAGVRLRKQRIGPRTIAAEELERQQ